MQARDLAGYLTRSLPRAQAVPEASSKQARGKELKAWEAQQV